MTPTTNSTINVTVAITELHTRSFGKDEILDLIPKSYTELYNTIAASDEPAIAALLHRLQIDEPQHRLIVEIWDAMSHRSEVTGENWSFSVA